MNRDPIDELGARLFKVAREEPLPNGAERRALEAARDAGSPARGTMHWLGARSKLLLLAAAFALVLGVLSFGRRQQPSSSIGPEPVSAPSHARDRAAPAPPLPTAATTASAETKLPPRAAPMPVRSAPASLSDELEVLKVAESALGSGDTEAALKALDRYDNALTGKKKLGAEATLLRIETLSRAGRAEAAAELARRFINKNPASPLVDRARSFAQSKQER